MRRNLPPKKNFLGKSIPGFPNHVIEKHVAKGANGHLFRAFSDKLGSHLAFKIVPIDNLVIGDRKEQYLDEAKKANALENQAVVRYHDLVEYVDPDSSKQCIIFVCDFVNGDSLKDYIDHHSHNINISFVRDFLTVILGLLFELSLRDYQHGDLHAGNILVVKSQYDITGSTRFRVTDFGVRNFTSPSTGSDDFLNIAKILHDLLACIDYAQLGGLERYYFNALRDRFLRRHLYETNTAEDPLARNARELLNKLNQLEDEYREAGTSDIGGRLNTPFDYPNCEQIGNSNLLLKALYSDRLLELSKIEAHSNVVLTGPRGCGKTTVYRALSLAYRYAINLDAPQDIKYIGVYYRCDDLYFNFPRYEDASREEAIDIPMHFLITTLISLLLTQLKIWARRHFSDEWERSVTALVGKLWEICDWQPPDSPSAADITTFTHKLEKQRRRSAQAQRFVEAPNQNIKDFFGPGKMIDICNTIRRSCPFLAERPFYFFIDDYSRPKITSALQANLNRLLTHRSSDIFFKLSTESPVSFVRHDLDGKQFAEAREFDFINLGVRYITDKSDQTLAFIKDLFRRRFSAVDDYPVGELEQLLGSCPRNENARARVFRREADAKEKKAHRYYAGVELVAAMCSGDIHHIIRLVGRMVDDFGGMERLRQGASTPCIPVDRQHQSIRNEAGAVMEAIRTVPDVGQRMADVVAVFGKVAQSYLLHRTSKNEAGNPPHQASKIEPYDALKLSDDARNVLDELLRYSVFIEDPKGKSRRGNVVPRFFLRRSLIPHFGLTFSQRDSVELENADIERLLTYPDKFEHEFRMKKKLDISGVDDLFEGKG